MHVNKLIVHTLQYMVMVKAFHFSGRLSSKFVCPLCLRCCFPDSCAGREEVWYGWIHHTVLPLLLASHEECSSENDMHHLTICYTLDPFCRLLRLSSWWASPLRGWWQSSNPSSSEHPNSPPHNVSTSSSSSSRLCSSQFSLIFRSFWK